MNGSLHRIGEWEPTLWTLTTPAGAMLIPVYATNDHAAIRLLQFSLALAGIQIVALTTPE